MDQFQSILRPVVNVHQFVDRMVSPSVICLVRSFPFVSGRISEEGMLVG